MRKVAGPMPEEEWAKIRVSELVRGVVAVQQPPLPCAQLSDSASVGPAGAARYLPEVTWVFAGL